VQVFEWLAAMHRMDMSVYRSVYSVALQTQYILQSENGITNTCMSWYSDALFCLLFVVSENIIPELI
jgi:hypothetical protein